MKPGHATEMPEFTGADWTEPVEEARAEHGLVGLGFAAARGGQLVAAGVSGERLLGSGVPLTVHDQWHVGSNGKSMTATAAASLVREGAIAWDTPVTEVFPDADSSWAQVTLGDLLRHRGGVPDYGVFETFQWWFDTRPPSQVRGEWVREVLLKEAVLEDRGEFRYSNTGYLLAGAMLEQVSGSDWQTLMRERVFEPIGMERAGFGPPPLPYNPSGHSGAGPGRGSPVGDSKLADNPAVVGPAGIVHLPLDDWARFTDAHMKVIRGEPGPLDGDAYSWLHEPPDTGDPYAGGWFVFEPDPDREWTDGEVHFHNGSNVSNYGLMALAPDEDLTLLCVSNSGDIETIEDVCIELTRQLGPTLRP